MPDHQDNIEASQAPDCQLFAYKLETQLIELESCRDILDMLSTFIEPPTSKAKLPDFNVRIFKQNHATPTDRLSALPAELKMYVLSELNDIDKTMFALACKANAAFLNSLNLKWVSRKAESRKAGVRNPSAEASLLSRASIGTRSLTRTNRFKLLYRVRKEVPQKYRFCFNCVRFVSARHQVNRMGWSTQKRDYELPRRGGMAKAMREGPRCPSCRAHELLQVPKAANLLKEVQRQVDAFKVLAERL